MLKEFLKNLTVLYMLSIAKQDLTAHKRKTEGNTGWIQVFY